MGEIFDLNYAESLTIPEGYQLVQLVATTYSLEPEMVYLLMTLTEKVTSTVFWDELALKKCLRSYLAEHKKPRKIKIFYQEDKMYCKGLRLASDFANLLDLCCIPIAKGQYAFHPKIIFAEYQNVENGAMKQRLIVSSRNLTMADFVECACVLEKETEEAAGDFTEINEFIDFVNNGMWKYNGDAADVFFQGSKSDNLLKKMNLLNSSAKKIIVSPFYTGGEFSKNIKNATFFQSEVIHSKLFYFETETENYIWLGSANCTKNGLMNNYECAVKIKTELRAEDIVKWIEKHNGKMVNPQEIGVNVETSSAEKELEQLINTHEFRLKLEKMGGQKYKCSITIAPDLKGSVALCDKVEIGIMGSKQMKKISEPLLEWELRKMELSLYAVLCLPVGNGKKIRRMVKMQVQDKTFEEIKRDNIKKIIDQKLDDFIPSCVYTTEYEEIEEGDDSDDLMEPGSRMQIGEVLSQKDGLYEKIVKLSACGEDALIQNIYQQIQDNKELYGENIQKVLTWLSWIKEE